MSITNNNNNNTSEERAAVTRSESFDSLSYIEQLDGDKEIATTDSSNAKPGASSSNTVDEMDVDIKANENDSSFWLDASNSFWLQSCTELLQVH